MSDEKTLIKVSNDHGEATLVLVIFLSIVLFAGEPDMFDLLMKILTHWSQP